MDENRPAAGPRGRQSALFVLASLLLASLIANALLYSRAPRPLVGAGAESLVERARSDAGKAFNTTASEAAESTFPIVTRLAGRSCVELRSTRRDRAGNYFACYDDRSGRLIEEVATVDF